MPILVLFQDEARFGRKKISAPATGLKLLQT
jgi:hypothetical protein